jgi:hypothetical protein
MVTITIIITWVPKLLEMPVKNDNPPLIWIAPNPKVVATPTTVAKIAIISIILPIGPSAFLPKTGDNVALMSPGLP